MSKYLFSDFATTTLATGISEGATSCTVAAGNGALFPSPNSSTGTKFLATLQSATNPNTVEVVTVTARSTDTMTMTPTVNAYSAGDYFALRNAAEQFDVFAQFDDLQAQATNFALDTGTANAYVVGLTPSLGAHVDGMPIRFRVGSANTNTGNCTFNDGAGSASLLNSNGQQLPPGTLIGKSTYTVFWSAANSCFQLDGGAYQGSGSWTTTLSGPFTSNPSGTLKWELTGNHVEIWCDSAITATATSSTAISASGLPAIITPSSLRKKFSVGLASGGGVDFCGEIAIQTNNTLLIYLCDISGATYLQGLGNFPATTATGIGAGWSVSYSL